jgi:hypothetical protein
VSVSGGGLPVSTARTLDREGVSVGRTAHDEPRVVCRRPPPLFIRTGDRAHNHGSVERPRSGRESRPVQAVGLDRGGDQPNIYIMVRNHKLAQSHHHHT